MSKKTTSLAKAAGVPRPRWRPEHRASRQSLATDYSRKGKKRWCPSKEAY